MKLRNHVLFIAIFLSACTTVTEMAVVTPLPEIFSSPSKVTISFKERKSYETFTESVGRIRAATFSNGRTKIAICHAGTPEIVIWDLIERKQTVSLSGYYHCFSIAFSPNSETLATGFYSGGKNLQPTLVIWDIG